MLEFDRRYWIAAIFVLLLAFFMAGVKYGELKAVRKADTEAFLNSIGENPAEHNGEINSKEAINQADEIELIEVYVSGEVNKPGIYQLENGARVYKAVELAGGTTEEADIKLFGMAQELVDGETLYIPAQGENAGLDTEKGISTMSSSRTALLNINKASAAEMAEKLNGIGPALSQRIVDYRDSHGSFTSIEEIKNVSGIGDKRFEDIKASICVK
jgi:competence protein ComEA